MTTSSSALCGIAPSFRSETLANQELCVLRYKADEPPIPAWPEAVEAADWQAVEAAD